MICIQIVTLQLLNIAECLELMERSVTHPCFYNVAISKAYVKA